MAGEVLTARQRRRKAHGGGTGDLRELDAQRPDVQSAAWHTGAVTLEEGAVT